MILCKSSKVYVAGTPLSLLVCPVCSNRLQISKVPAGAEGGADQNRFECRTCPYQHIIVDEWFEGKTFKRKEVEDAIDSKEVWANADKMEAQCPNAKCTSREAYFYQLQIRSADEPMTTFLRVFGPPAAVSSD